MEKTIEQRLRLPGSIQKWSVTGLVLMASVFFCLSQAEAFFDATVFGGKTLNTTTETTFGGAFGLFLFFELEFSSLLYQEEVSTYNCNLKLPLGFPADDTFIGGYLTGGGGSFADHTMWNGGGGLWFSPRLVYHDPRVPLEIALRLDYRHLWIRGEENLHRVYIGLWFVPQNPLLTD